MAPTQRCGGRDGSCLSDRDCAPGLGLGNLGPHLGWPLVLLQIPLPAAREVGGVTKGGLGLAPLQAPAGRGYDLFPGGAFSCPCARAREVRG